MPQNQQLGSAGKLEDGSCWRWSGQGEWIYLSRACRGEPPTSWSRTRGVSVPEVVPNFVPHPR